MGDLKVDASLHSINISWNPLLSQIVNQPLNQTYTLAVISSSNQSIFSTKETHIVFNTSAIAPKCEVYNFSVTGLYDTVGITYIGDICSVPSLVLNQMIPSEPDINTLESSLSYELAKESIGGVSLAVSFKVSCKIEFKELTFHLCTA